MLFCFNTNLVLKPGGIDFSTEESNGAIELAIRLQQLHASWVHQATTHVWLPCLAVLLCFCKLASGARHTWSSDFRELSSSTNSDSLTFCLRNRVCMQSWKIQTGVILQRKLIIIYHHQRKDKYGWHLTFERRQRTISWQELFLFCFEGQQVLLFSLAFKAKKVKSLKQPDDGSIQTFSVCIQTALISRAYGIYNRTEQICPLKRPRTRPVSVSMCPF